MSIKKTLLLATLAVAAVALAAPVAAQADPRWYDDELGDYVPENHHAELHAVGDLTFDFPNGFQVGPCTTTYGGLAENNNAMAAGTVTNVVHQEECETNVEGCTSKPTSVNLPWELTGTTKITGETAGVEIKEMTMTFHMIGTCPVPITTLAVKGTGTPINCVPGCLTFEGHADDLKLEAPLPGLAVDITGTLYLTDPMTLGPST